MNSTTNNTYNGTIVRNFSSDSWGDLLKNNQRLEFDALLQSDLLAATRLDTQVVTCIYWTTGSISIIASIAIIVHILRSKDGLSTTYHRLIFGLSIADIISTMGFASASLLTPKEMNYIKPFAIGSMNTCRLQGFMSDIGLYAAALYNSSVCLYYLAIIKYSKKEDYIRKKLEPWFHAVSIIYPFCFGIMSLSTNAYFFDSYDGRFCFADPSGFVLPPQPHCLGYENGDIIDGFSIPCRQGIQPGKKAVGIIATIMAILVLVLIPPCVCIVTMVLMYKAVSKIEKRMQNYGVGSLTLNRDQQQQQGNNNNTTIANNCGENADTEMNSSRTRNDDDNNEEVTTMNKIKKFFTRMIPPYGSSSHNSDQSNNNNLSRRASARSTNSRSKMSSSKRAIFQMAIGYVTAWGMIYIPGAVFVALLSATAPQEPIYQFSSIALACSSPLQGLYNFIVFMSQKVRAVKSSRAGRSENLTWVQAFFIAYQSKEDRRRRSTTGASGSGGRRNSNSGGSTTRYGSSHRRNSNESTTSSVRSMMKSGLSKFMKTPSSKNVITDTNNYCNELSSSNPPQTSTLTADHESSDVAPTTTSEKLS